MRSRAETRPAYPINIVGSGQSSPIVHRMIAELIFRDSQLFRSVNRTLSTSVSANIIRMRLPRPPLPLSLSMNFEIIWLRTVNSSLTCRKRASSSWVISTGYVLRSLDDSLMPASIDQTNRARLRNAVARGKTHALALWMSLGTPTYESTPCSPVC